MSNPVTFIDGYVGKIQQLVLDLKDLREQNDMLTQDPTLIDRYFSAASPRTDIVPEDVTNAKSALVQILFTYDSGSPTQKSYLQKMLP
jgi:hypothetical protein